MQNDSIAIFILWYGDGNCFVFYLLNIYRQMNLQEYLICEDCN